MLEALKNQIARIGAVAPQAQRGERQRMGGVIGQIETALQAQFFTLGVVQAANARADQALDFLIGSRLALEPADTHQVIELRVRHLRFRRG